MADYTIQTWKQDDPSGRLKNGVMIRHNIPKSGMIFSFRTTIIRLFSNPSAIKMNGCLNRGMVYLKNFSNLP